MVNIAFAIRRHTALCLGNPLGSVVNCIHLVNVWSNLPSSTEVVDIELAGTPYRASALELVCHSVFASPMQRIRNRRWIALDADGRHIAQGCHSDPSETDIARLEAELGRQGIGGVWLAVAEGDYWKPRTRMSLLMVRSIGSPDRTWKSAEAAFFERRQASLQPA